MGHDSTAHTLAPRQAVATRALSDDEFLAAFETCALGADAFRHYDHIRLAWIYLRAAAVDEATELMAVAIRRFALYHTGSTAKYSESVTRAWMHLVARARELGADAPDFAAFAAANPVLFDRQRAFDFYGVAAP